jgi:hypothetical protein
MRGVRAKIVVAALKAQGLVLEEEQEKEPEEVESVTACCCWCAYIRRVSRSQDRTPLCSHTVSRGSSSSSLNRSSNVGGSLKA